MATAKKDMKQNNPGASKEMEKIQKRASPGDKEAKKKPEKAKKKK